MLRLTKHLYRLCVLILFLALELCSVPAYARSKNRTSRFVVASQIQQIDEALQSNEVASAETIATAYFAQATNASLQSSSPNVIIDPVMAGQTAELIRSGTAFEIARCFYNHAELDIAKRWATTATMGGTLAEQQVRLATVLLGNIASAMDKNDEAVEKFTSVIQLPNLNREQALAYAGLLEVFMLQKQNDLVPQWVQQGRAQFAGSDFELDFLKKASEALKRRNHPLWRDLDQQIVSLSSAGLGSKLNALRQLASNARKFGRWAEAETNYAAICALPIGSPQDTVNAFLFLAEVQAKQSKDFTSTLQNLQSNVRAFARPDDREYAVYRVGKFYEEQDRLDSAATNYQVICSSSSTSTWAAASLHQLAGIREKQGDLQTALQLYQQYPKRFPQNPRLKLQSYAKGLNVAMTLGNTNMADQIAATITNSAASLADYNAQLHLAFYFWKRGNQPMMRQFLERGLSQVSHALATAPGSRERYQIHFNVLKHLSYYGHPQRTLDWFSANPVDLPDSPMTTDVLGLQCYAYKAFALSALKRTADAMALMQELLDQVDGNPELEIKFTTDLGQMYEWSSDNASAAPFFEAIALKYPSHEWANLGRLRLAIQKFNAGDFAGAIKLTEDITSYLPDNSKRGFIKWLYWSAVYVRGCCLQAQGLNGDSLMQMALTRIPNLAIQRELHKR
jgi:tetratricopeptide (TPR) repeat protein